MPVLSAIAAVLPRVLRWFHYRGSLHLIAE